jgi:hypothetical protein
MPSPSSHRTSLVLRPSLRKLSAIFLIVSAAPSLRAQAPAPGLGCGDRAPGEYAVVLDASSSLQHGTRLTRQTEESYVDVLERLAGILCRGEKMVVYPVVKDDTLRMVAVDSVLPSNRSRERLREVVRATLRRDPKHSDFLLAVNRTRADILSRPNMRAVFFLTDGSFYPHPLPPVERRLQSVRDRLSELDQVIAQLDEVPTPFRVIGIRAREAAAVDPQLTFAWPDSADRAWLHGTRSYDLKTLSGDSLLSTLFGTAYVPLERLDLWNLLIGNPTSPWQRLLGYSGGWTRALPDLRSVRMEHLMFVPADSGGPASCARVRYGPRSDGAPQPVQPVRVGARLFACSLERPTASELDSIAARGVSGYAFRQTPRFHPVEDLAPLYGLHEFILSLDGTPCPEWTLSRDVLHGRGPPGGPRVGMLEIVPVTEARAIDTVAMVAKPSSPCIVPNVAMDTTSERQGDYLLFVSDTAGEWVHHRRFAPPRLQLSSLDFRPGGFPFPPGRLALLGLCVNSAVPMRPGEKLVVELDMARHELEGNSRNDCPIPLPGARRPYVYGFRGVVLLESTNLVSARVGIAPGGQSSSIPHRGGWLPVALTPNGTWFLARGCLMGSALLGVVMQVGYLWYFAGVRPRHLRRLRRLLSLSLSVFISGTLVVVFTEFCVMVTQSPIKSSSIPIPFGLVVFGHALKLLAAALVPELVEDTLLDD